ncbi:MAG: hypothetical protein J6X44_09155, partial [Thermoguttaceae bacterium]|nr:hypothetical protein [Thermoguttaceae bacterium]
GIDEQRRVSYKVDDVVRAIVEIGGTYPDGVSFLTQAKSQKKIYVEGDGGASSECPLAIDALPGSKTSHFKKVKDVQAIAEREAAKERAEREANKPSVWSKMNPASWFAKSDGVDNEDFSLEEFDKANEGSAEESEEFELNPDE